MTPTRQARVVWSPLQQITVTIAGHEHTAADPLTDTAREILTATGTD